MEILAAIGLGAKELFAYNRENYKFDQDQRLEREVMRMEMQVKRFELFREDVRDLVELTVGRMDVYHLVGALFLEFCVSFMCEGRVQAAAPPFILSLFLLSNACAFVYLLLAVWLSMHASIASHSFGVRLLTRFVRLPIPSAQHIMGLSSQLANFESQGISNILRLPIVQDAQRWLQSQAQKQAAAGAAAGAAPEDPAASAGEGAASASATGAAAGPTSAAGKDGGRSAAAREPGPSPKVRLPDSAVPRTSAGASEISDSSRSRGGGGSAAGVSGVGADAAEGANPASSPPETDAAGSHGPGGAPHAGGGLAEIPDFLGRGEPAFTGEEMLLRPSAASPGLHVQLFRQLQAKWQCYDAYCRVCMALGVNQILQGLSYYAIVHTLVENRSASAGYAMLAIFQACALALSILDIAGLKRRAILFVQGMGTLPVVLAAIAVSRAPRTSSGLLEPHEDYPTSPAMFLLQAAWLEALLWVAAPSSDGASLPRRFRTVLFLDVFGDAADPTEAEYRPPPLVEEPDSDGGRRWWTSQDERMLTAERVASAENALRIAQAAVRRWEAAPGSCFSDAQREELKRLRVDFGIWRRALQGELAWRAASRGLPEHDPLWGDERDMQPWGEIPVGDRDDDVFRGFLIGPLDYDSGYDLTTYHYDVERVSLMWEAPPAGANILTLQHVSSAIRGLEAAVRLLLAMGEPDMARQQQEEDSSIDADGASSPFRRELSPSSPGSIERGCCFPAAAAASVLPRLSDVGRMAVRYAREVEMTEPLDRPLLRRGSSGGQSAEAAVAAGVGLGTGDAGTMGRPRANSGGHRAALAGPHEKKFVPERLPWQVLRGVTRALQACWVFTGAMAVLRELGVYRIDFQQHHGHERRLQQSQQAVGSVSLSGEDCTLEPWQFQEVNVSWPHGSFFRPKGLASVPGEPNHLYVSSSYASYKAISAGPTHDSSYWMEELQEDAALLPGAVRFCADGSLPAGAPSVGAWCLLGVPSPNGVTVWTTNDADAPGAEAAAEDDGGRWDEPQPRRLHEPVVRPDDFGDEENEASSVLLRLPKQSRPWRLLAGAIVACHHPVVARAALRDSSRENKLCLLLAGWDGEELPVAIVPLPGPGLLPNRGTKLRPRYSVPASASRPCAGGQSAGTTCSAGQVPDGREEICEFASVSRQVAALHVDHVHGRLWALYTPSGHALLEAQVWDLHKMEELGSWHLRHPFLAGFVRLSAICDSGAGTVHVAGVADAAPAGGTGMSAGGFGRTRPVLLSAPSPLAALRQ